MYDRRREAGLDLRRRITFLRVYNFCNAKGHIRLAHHHYAGIYVHADLVLVLDKHDRLSLLGDPHHSIRRMRADAIRIREAKRDNVRRGTFKKAPYQDEPTIVPFLLQIYSGAVVHRPLARYTEGIRISSVILLERKDTYIVQGTSLRIIKKTTARGGPRRLRMVADLERQISTVISPRCWIA